MPRRALDQPTRCGSTEPQLTVVIPVWDRYVLTVRDAVESVLDQGVHVAVLVVDNASSKLLPPAPARRRRGAGCPRASRSAQRGTRASPSVRDRVLVLFLDADDIVLEGTLRLLLSRMTARPALSACACSVLAWNAATDQVCPLELADRVRRGWWRDGAAGARLCACDGEPDADDGGWRDHAETRRP